MTPADATGRETAALHERVSTLHAAILRINASFDLDAGLAEVMDCACRLTASWAQGSHVARKLHTGQGVFAKLELRVQQAQDPVARALCRPAWPTLERNALMCRIWHCSQEMSGTAVPCGAGFLIGFGCLDGACGGDILRRVTGFPAAALGFRTSGFRAPFPKRLHFAEPDGN